MNREIKFRAWNIETKKMSLWDYIKKVKNLNKLLTLNHVVMMQYTGLKDKNGVEIYEGDILSWRIRDQKCVASVEYINGYLCASDMKTHYYVDPVDYKLCEVIGNIYENPELLEDRS